MILIRVNLVEQMPFDLRSHLNSHSDCDSIFAIKFDVVDVQIRIRCIVMEMTMAEIEWRLIYRTWTCKDRKVFIKKSWTVYPKSWTQIIYGFWTMTQIILRYAVDGTQIQFRIMIEDHAFNDGGLRRKFKDAGFIAWVIKGFNCRQFFLSEVALMTSWLVIVPMFWKEASSK